MHCFWRQSSGALWYPFSSIRFFFHVVVFSFPFFYFPHFFALILPLFHFFSVVAFAVCTESGSIVPASTTNRFRIWFWIKLQTSAIRFASSSPFFKCPEKWRMYAMFVARILTKSINKRFHLKLASSTHMWKRFHLITSFCTTRLCAVRPVSRNWRP